MVEINTVEVIRSNQKVFDLSATKYTPSTVAAKGSLVAIGAEVIVIYSLCVFQYATTHYSVIRIPKYTCINGMAKS